MACEVVEGKVIGQDRNKSLNFAGGGSRGRGIMSFTLDYFCVYILLCSEIVLREFFFSLLCGIVSCCALLWLCAEKIVKRRKTSLKHITNKLDEKEVAGNVVVMRSE